jgi:hypothetical protein
MSLKRFTLADLPPKYLAQVEHQLSGGKPLGQARAGAIGKVEIAGVSDSPKRRLRQSQKPLMNALETRFHEKLKHDYGTASPILCQAVRLELSRGQWYKPDFFVPFAGYTTDKATGEKRSLVVAYECKGPHVFRGGFENLKTAARVHQWCKFFLVWEDENRVWQRQEVLA